MKLVYLASPYSDPDPAVRAARFEAVCRIAGRLMAGGAFIYSPIAHNHPIALLHGLPTGWGWWGEFDRRMIEACDGVTVARMPGWDRSVGVAAEIEIARGLGKPVSWMDSE